MSPAAFRILVLSSPLLSVAAVGIDILAPSLAFEAAATSPTTIIGKSLVDTETFTEFVLFPWALAGVAGLVGLFFFKRWARTLCVVWTVVGLGLAPLFGPAEMSGWSSALNEASFTLWGGALALSFYGPPAQRFGLQREDDG